MNDAILDRLEDVARQLITQRSATEAFEQRLLQLGEDLHVSVLEGAEGDTWDVKVDSRDLEIEGLLARRIHTSLVTLTASTWKLLEEVMSFSFDLRSLRNGATDLAEINQSAISNFPVAIQDVADKWFMSALETSHPEHRFHDLIDIMRGPNPTIVPKANIVVSGSNVSTGDLDASSSKRTITLNIRNRETPIYLAICANGLMTFGLTHHQREVSKDVVRFLSDVYGISVAAFGTACDAIGYSELVSIEDFASHKRTQT